MSCPTRAQKDSFLKTKTKSWFCNTGTSSFFCFQKRISRKGNPHQATFLKLPSPAAHQTDTILYKSPLKGAAILRNCHRQHPHNARTMNVDRDPFKSILCFKKRKPFVLPQVLSFIWRISCSRKYQSRAPTLPYTSRIRYWLPHHEH